jgi:hypothetical protein
MALWTEVSTQDGTSYRRRDGYLVIFHAVGKWHIAAPNGDLVRTRQSKIRTWKTARKAMKAVDAEFPYSPPWSRMAALIHRHKGFLRSTLPAWIVRYDR